MARFFSSILPLLFSLGTLAAECPTAPLTGLFYQPLVVDLQLSSTEWHTRIEQLKHSGFNELYLQWTAHGEVNFLASNTQDGKPFLKTLADAAANNDIHLYFGLHADPDWFENSRQSGPTLTHYLSDLRIQSLSQAANLTKAISTEAIAGWYLPEEINDRDWPQLSKRNQLRTHLKLLSATLNSLTANKPVFVSAYAGGEMPAQEFAGFLNTLLKPNNLSLLYQDGSGTGSLNRQHRYDYVYALNRRFQQDRWRIIVELFKQDRTDIHVFKAKPGTVTEIAGNIEEWRAINPALPLAGFSLRYLFHDQHYLLDGYNARYCRSPLPNAVEVQ